MRRLGLLLILAALTAAPAVHAEFLSRPSRRPRLAHPHTALALLFILFTSCGTPRPTIIVVEVDDMLESMLAYMPTVQAELVAKGAR